MFKRKHEMNYNVHVLAVPIIFFVVSCAFVPKISEEQKYSESCKMLTKNLTLSLTEIKGSKCSDNDDIEACLVLFGVVIPASSFIVSGSIVLAGKTLHWLEYQGTCANSIFLKNINRLKKKILNRKDATLSKRCHTNQAIIYDINDENTAEWHVGSNYIKVPNATWKFHKPYACKDFLVTFHPPFLKRYLAVISGALI